MVSTTKGQRIMTQPIGFDEYINLVLNDAEEINFKNTRKST